MDSVNLHALLDHLMYYRDEYTAKHSKTVSVICEKLGKDLGYPDSIIKHLVTAGYLHDIGKITWDDHLLWGIKKGNGLSEEDKVKIKDHPKIAGAFLHSLMSAPTSNPTTETKLLYIPLICTHHWKHITDDRDYPQQTSIDPLIQKHLSPVISDSGSYDAISYGDWALLRGIIQIADCFHATVSHRIYRPPFRERTTEEAIADLNIKHHSDGGIHYHPCVLGCLGKNKKWLMDLIGR